MNLLLFSADDLSSEGRLRLQSRDRRARHMRQVLRAAVGDRVRVGMIRGPQGHAHVVSMTAEAIELELAFALGRERGSGPVEEADSVSSRRPSVDLLLAVPRPKTLTRMIETAAAIGVGHIDLVNAWRVDKSYLSSHALAPEHVRRHATIGCELGAHTWVPTVDVHRLLMPFVRGQLDHRLRGVQTALLAHPRAQTPIEDVLKPGMDGRVLVAIGPERGFTDLEIDTLSDAGLCPISFAMPVLSVAAAVTTALAQVALLRRLSPSL